MENLPMYFGVTYDYFIAAIRGEMDDERKKLVASVADEYSNTPDFITYPVQYSSHLMMSNLSAHVANQVFLDNLLMLDAQAEAFKQAGMLDETAFSQAKEGYNSSEVLERVYEKLSLSLDLNLPEEHQMACKVVLVSKLAEQNRYRLNDALIYKNIQVANKQFLQGMML